MVAHTHTIYFWQLPFCDATTALSQLILKRSLETREGKQDMGIEIGVGIRISILAQCYQMKLGWLFVFWFDSFFATSKASFL